MNYQYMFKKNHHLVEGICISVFTLVFEKKY